MQSVAAASANALGGEQRLHTARRRLGESATTLQVVLEHDTYTAAAGKRRQARDARTFLRFRTDHGLT